MVDPDGKAFYVAVGDLDAMTTTLKADYVPVWNAPDGTYERDVEIDLDEELLKLFEDKYDEYEEGNLIFDIEDVYKRQGHGLHRNSRPRQTGCPTT